ncbi:MAG: ribosome hibernation-promoting factor, HPF/YfiA family, partial [Phenylobacterium sp.]
MQVQVTGKHVDVGEALRSRVSDELSSSIGKYFDRGGGGGADVVVSREGHAFKVDCAVTLASGQQLTTQGLGGDAHLAFDAAMLKMQKRIRRYKNRLTDHHPQALARQAETAAYYVLQAPDDGPDSDDDVDGEPAGFPEPMVIAETETEI